MNGNNPEPSSAGSEPPPRPPKRIRAGLGDSDGGRKFTIAASADGEGKFIRGSRGRAMHGHVIISVTPSARGKGVTVLCEVNERVIPKRFFTPIAEGIRSSLEYGFQGNSVVDVVVRVIGGSFENSSPDDLAFKMAGIFAVKDALKRSEPLPLE